MSSCACDGSVSDVGQSLPDAAYHLAGTTTPNEDALAACQQAVGTLRAAGIDPCDPNYDEALQNEFQIALKQVANVVQSTPVFNPLQRAIDTAIGTASPDVATVRGAPAGSKPATNIFFIIGAIIILAIGFVLVFT